MFTPIVDSIALIILDESALLTGIGNELHLFRTQNDTTCAQQTTSTQLEFKLRAKVHGIVSGCGLNNKKLLIYGEKEFMLLEWTPDHYQFELVHRALLSDWISAGAFLNESAQFVLLTAHSTLLRFDFSAECKERERISCTEKSTLYCALIYGKQWKNLVIFSGNAFGELLIWQPMQTTIVDERQQSPLLQRIQAHNGVIFSIDYNAKCNLLTTTSDDRSIKFWLNAFENNLTLHEVGDWSAVKLQPLASGFGHAARVFQGKIIEHANKFYAITVGEDSFFCVWRTSGELLFKRRQHFGATIWNFAFDQDNLTLFTIGSTGNILAYGLQDILKNTEESTVLELLPKIGTTTTGIDEYVAKIKFLTINFLVGVTNKNRFVYKNLNDTESVAINEPNSATIWNVVADFSGHKCTVLEVKDNLIVLCGYKCLTLYEFNENKFQKLYDGAMLNGIIRAFQFLDALQYLVSDEYGNCLLLKGKDLQERYILDLPKCKERWLTTALLLPSTYDESNVDVDGLLVSNRLGNLIVYQRQSKNGQYELKHILKQVHGKLGATALRHVRTTSTEIFINSAGHDGTLKLLCLQRATCTLKLYTRQTVPVAWVEALCGSNEDIDKAELVLGFNDNHFVAWTPTHDFLLQLSCGGGHRCWHYMLFTDPTTQRKCLKLVFIKRKQVFVHNFKCLYNECGSTIALPKRNMWHTRSCNILRVISPSTEKRSSSTLEQPNKLDLYTIISAGDDNLIKISSWHPQGPLQQQCELHTHISNIRCLHLVQLNESEYLIFSGGGRAQFCVNKLNLANYQVQELNNYTVGRSTISESPLQQQINCNGYNIDAETRVMAVDVARVELQASNTDACNNQNFHVYLACSDGYLRKFLWQSSSSSLHHPHQQQQKRPMQLLTEIYFDKCLLQLRLIADYVLVAATDGILHFYSRDLSTNQLQLKLHESGINALDAQIEQPMRLLHILTGGDDQVVIYIKLQIDATAQLQVLQKTELQKLHTAQVTAALLRLTKESFVCDSDVEKQETREMQVYAYTSGVDQNLIEYNVTADHLQNVHHGCVADVKGISMDALLERYFFIYGCGLQVIGSLRKPNEQ